MKTRQYKIIEKKNLWFTISFTIIAIGIGLMVSRVLKHEPALNFGIDFQGGNSLLLKFEQLHNIYAQNTDKAKSELNSQFIGTLRQTLSNYGLDKSTIQITQGKEVLIKTLKLKEENSLKLLRYLEKEMGNIEVLEIDYIGPSIGHELKSKSFWIIGMVTAALLLYITIRFQFLFGISAIIALLHDALITISLASIYAIEINTAFVAALLTILGYSINDTIVVFDRIRENIQLHGKKAALTKLTNLSLNQTLTRTINTSITTLLVIGSLILFGGTTIKAFCIVLLIGILSGTYSSLFIAAPVLTQLKKD